MEVWMINLAFYASALVVLPFWGLMIFWPNAALTYKAVRSVWIVMPPVMCYLMVLAGHWRAFLGVDQTGGTDWPSPKSIQMMLNSEAGATFFWAYAGAFDLFVGRWIFFDAKQRNITHWLVAPCLLVAIVFGPLGLSMYGCICLVYAFPNSKKYK